MKIGIDIAAIVDLFREHKFDGLLAIETDHLHPDYTDLDAVLARSVTYLSDLVSSGGAARSKPQ
ncbi:hypothetical protein [Rhizobium sp. YK2]|uniref:hypothetical protein n=1 Tax=Rhizobium sp. YK2 TaxID=1860096 RepID=UPI00084C54E7|nr:hypothetical protein [Rhizobium sp. YK2]OED00807.1 hypothetical protein A9Z06_12695 [Rhizobium sp. YK2]